MSETFLIQCYWAIAVISYFKTACKYGTVAIHFQM